MEPRTVAVAGMAAVLGAVALVYAQTLSFPFVEWDDPFYVTRNAIVQQGLTGEGLRWAFTTTEVANWHPLTWLSHMLDCEIAGVDAGSHHRTNLLLHLANTVLLFAFLARATGRWLASGFAAGLFALHPLHVETVAWVSERKGLLSTSFGLLALLAYASYSARPGAARMLGVAACFAASLLAKPLWLPLPALLLLLDVWPLQRARTTGGPTPGRRLVIEKLPLAALSAASLAVTFAVQEAGGAMGPGEAIPLAQRLAHAAVATLWYLGKTLLPLGLSPLYTHPYLPGGTPWASWQIAGSAALLAAISLAVWRARRRRPYLLFGWGWYLSSLAPVIGLAQVGFQGYADRYTYVSLIGPFVALCCAIEDAVAAGAPAERRETAAGVLGIGAVVLAALAVASAIQTRHWRSSTALFERVLEVSPENPMGHFKLGNLAMGRDPAAAAEHFREAVRIDPGFWKARMNLGHVLLEQHDVETAIVHLREAAKSPRSEGKPQRYLGFAYAQLERFEEAASVLRESIRLDPKDSRAQQALGAVLEALGRLDEALEAYERAAALEPGWPVPRASLERLRAAAP